jgi:hypothetical protein
MQNCNAMWRNLAAQEKPFGLACITLVAARKEEGAKEETGPLHFACRSLKCFIPLLRSFLIAYARQCLSSCFTMMLAGNIIFFNERAAANITKLHICVTIPFTQRRTPNTNSRRCPRRRSRPLAPLLYPPVVSPAPVGRGAGTCSFCRFSFSFFWFPATSTEWW